MVFGIHSKYVKFGSTGSLVKLEYAVDGAHSKILSMISAKGIAITADVKPFAQEMLGGNVMLIGVSVAGGSFLHSKISLRGSDRAITRVFADCGQNLRK